MANRYLGVSLAAALSLSLMGGSAQAQVKIVFNSFAPPTFVINQGMIDAWAKNVERVTEGRVKVEIPATSLAPPPQQWEMVTQGVADGAYIFLGFAQKRLLLPQIATLPFGTPSATAQAIALWRTHKQFFEKANESEGVVLIGYFGSPAAYLWSSNKPIAAVGDLKDVKTWSLPGDQARALAALGAVIVPGPAVRSYEIISKGIVEAWGGHNFDGSASFNTTQYAKAVTLVPGGIGAAAFAVFLNKAKWDSIPKRDQDLIMSVSGEEIAKLTKVWDDREAAAFARAKQEGRLQITTASPQLMADLQKTWAFLQDEWVANAATRNIDGKAALKYYLDTVKELSR